LIIFEKFGIDRINMLGVVFKRDIDFIILYKFLVKKNLNMFISTFRGK